MVHYTYSQISSSGGRSRNEDSIQVQHINGSLLATVADGLGGEGGGDIAAQTAVSSIINFMNKSLLYTADNIIAAIKYADDAVISAQKKCEAMKTTIVLLCMDKENAICGHLGDSRLYHFRNNGICFQTKDHSVSQMAVSVGEITPEEIRFHADRNKLLRALGSRERMPADAKELLVRSGDGFLLCTDGFWELVLEDEMTDDFQKSQNAGQWLEKMQRRVESRLSNISDNYSAVTVIANDI